MTASGSHDDALIVGGAAGALMDAACDALEAAGATLRDANGTGLPAAVDGGRIVAWIVPGTAEIDRLLDLVENTPRLRFAHVMLFIGPGAAFEAWNARAWPATWDLLREPFEPAAVAHVLARMRRLARSRNRGMISIASRAPAADGFNPFSVEFAFDIALVEERGAPDSPLQALFQRLGPSAAPQLVLALQRARRSDDWSMEWLTPSDGDRSQQSRLILFRVLDPEGAAPRVVGTCLVLDGDLASSSADPVLLGMLQQSASGGQVSTWVWDITAGTWQVKGASGLRGHDGALHPQQAFDLVHSADRDAFRNCLRDSLKHGTRFLIECRLVMPGGDTRWYTIAGRPETDRDGVRTRILGVGVETTARKHAELALEEAQRQLADSLDAAGMCLWSFDLAAGTLFLAGPAQRLFGTVPEHLKSLRTIAHPDDDARVGAAFAAALADGASLDLEYRIRAPDGEERWLGVVGTPGVGAGQRRVLRGRIIDITRRKRDELLASDLAQRLRVALDAAGLSPWNIDLRTGVRTPGPRDTAFFGRELHHLSMFEEHVLPDELPLVRAFVQRAIADEGRVSSIEFRVRHLDGRVHWLSTRAHVLRGHDGDALGLYGVTFDVTARRTAEAAVQENRRQLNDALQAGRMLLWRWSRSRGFGVEYGTTLHLLGHGPLSTREFLRRLWHGDRERVRAAFSHSLEFGLPYSDEFRLLGNDGKLHTVHVQGLPYQRSDVDESRGIWGVLIDVSERKQIERERDQASARLYQALAAAGMTGFELPLDQFAVQPEAALREAFGEVMPADRATLDAVLAAAIDARDSFEHTYRVAGQDGVAAWRQAFGRFEPASAEAGARVSGVVMDVSRQKHAEIEVQAGRRWRDLAVDGAGMAVWEIDLATGARRGSPLDFTLFGFSPASLEEFTLLVHRDDLNPVEHVWDAAVQTGSPYSAEMRVRTVDGRYRWIAMHGRAVHEPVSGRRIMVGITMDIDARKRAEGEQRNALALARKASEAKSAFLASMSHEIRTPLNAVIGYTGLLADSALESPQRAHVETLRGSAQQLLSLINDVLDFSRIEAGELPLENAPFDLLDCIESSLDLVATQAEAKGLALAAVARCSTEQPLLGDVTRLRQIVVNLLSNAVKFTERGGVTCHADITTAGSKARIRIAVQDTGIGMSEPVRSRLFQPFQQGDASTTRRFGGTGLGLSICQRLVTLLGGRMRVDSRLGVGSRFEVDLELPLAEVTALRAPPALPARVAVAVRSEPMREALAQQLGAFHVDVVQVSVDADDFSLDLDGCDALVATEPEFQRLDARKRYPRNGDGVALPTLVLVGMDSDPATPPVRHGQRVLRLPRTLKPRALRAALHALHSGTPMSERTGPVRAKDAEPGDAVALRVLIAEDNAVNQKLLALQVEALGHRVQAVSSGSEALEALKIDRFDVVLMDVEMPQMDGIETARRIREELGERGEQLYIAAVTAHATQEMRRRVVTTVMDDFIAKPVVHEELVALLRRATDADAPAE